VISHYDNARGRVDEHIALVVDMQADRAEIADQGDPAERLRPAIEPLLALRGTLRKGGSYAEADQIRDALVAAGIAVQDSPSGTTWTVDG
jgi:cysteinyl-tRNA synthetase